MWRAEVGRVRGPTAHGRPSAVEAIYHGPHARPFAAARAEADREKRRVAQASWRSPITFARLRKHFHLERGSRRARSARRASARRRCIGEAALPSVTFSRRSNSPRRSSQESMNSDATIVQSQSSPERAGEGFGRDRHQNRQGKCEGIGRDPQGGVGDSALPQEDHGRLRRRPAIRSDGGVTLLALASPHLRFTSSRWRASDRDGVLAAPAFD